MTSATRKLSQRKSVWLGSLAFIGACALVPVLAFGPGSSDDPQAAALDARIAADPSNAELYLERAELFRTQGDRRAEADYDTAAYLAPGWADVDLARHRWAAQTGRTWQAARYLERYQAAHPEGEVAASTERHASLGNLSQRE
jgi:hypothetical protein